MESGNIIFEMILIYAGAAIFSTLFLYLKQPIILAYIALGIAIGPWGFGVIDNAEHIEKLSHLGIILLLFLIGLSMQPNRFYKLFGKISLLTLITCIAFQLICMSVALIFGFGLIESAIIGAAMMFSSTIVSLKLIPTTELHHEHAGEMMTSVLLFQDIIAIIIILLLSGGQEEKVVIEVAMLLLKLAFMVSVAFVLVRYVIAQLFMKFDTIREYTFLLSLGWGLFGAGAAKQLGLSYEIGAFIAGVSFATMPICLVIAEDLKPLRDFFLIMFFFSIGAQFNFLVTQEVLIAGAAMTAVIIIIKPMVFKWAFKSMGENNYLSTELGARLGQASEFSLLVGYSALLSGHIDPRASYLIQAVVILTFVISTYWVVFKYPTPISSTSKQRLD